MHSGCHQSYHASKQVVTDEAKDAMKRSALANGAKPEVRAARSANEFARRQMQTPDERSTQTHLGWVTRRANGENTSDVAKKGWATRRARQETKV